MASEDGDLRAERIQNAPPHLSNKDAKRIRAENSLLDLFEGQGWGKNIASGIFFRAAIKGIVAAGPGYEIQTGSTLSGSILERPNKAGKLRPTKGTLCSTWCCCESLFW